MDYPYYRSPNIMKDIFITATVFIIVLMTLLFFMENNIKEEENRCGEPHNNGDEECLECQIIKLNL